MTSPVRALALQYMQRQPADAARTLERLPSADAAPMLASAPASTAARILEQLAPVAASNCIARIPGPARRLIVAELRPDAAVGVLRRLPQSAQEDALADMPERDSWPIRRALRFPALSAGAMADRHVPVLRDDDIVGQAIQSLREIGERVPASLFVLNRSRRLIGAVSAGQLVIASSDATIGELGLDPVQTVSADIPLASLSADGQHRRPPLAVIDSSGELVGALTERVLHDAANREAASPAVNLAASASELYWLGLCWILGGFTARMGSAGRSRGAACGDD